MQILHCYYLPCHFGRAPSRLLGPLRLFLRGFLSPACLLLSFRPWEIPLHHFYLASGCGTFSDPSLGKGSFSFPRMVHSLGLSRRYTFLRVGDPSPGHGVRGSPSLQRLIPGVTVLPLDRTSQLVLYR